MTAQLFVLLGEHAVGQLTRDNAGSLLAHRGLAVLTPRSRTARVPPLVCSAPSG
ncbi:MAG: hypothetical protein QOI41_1151, partial [Myxococcales bacterium]|nr:hypothetical protein [Myxococcales bacterium]